MKTLIACLLVAVAGTAVAARFNHTRYGRFEPRFGPLTLDGRVSADNVRETLEEVWDEESPTVTTPEGRKHDFGAMSPEQTGEHSFLIRNEGPGRLRLTVGATTCKCTLGSLAKPELGAGEETQVQLSWTVKTNESRFGQSAEIRTNDPRNPAVRFEIEGQVVRSLEATPDQVSFNSVAANEPIEFRTKIYNHSGGELTFGRATLGDETMQELADIEVQSVPVTAEDGIHDKATQAFDVVATVRPGLPQGPVSANLSIGFAKAEQGEAEQGEKDQDVSGEALMWVSVPVTGRIVGQISMINSSRLRGVPGGGYLYDFGRIEPTDDPDGVAMIVLRGDDRDMDLQVLSAEPADLLSASLDPPTTAGTTTYRKLHLSLTPAAQRVQRTGRDDDDYGMVTLGSPDNPAALKLKIKFVLMPR